MHEIRETGDITRCKEGSLYIAGQYGWVDLGKVEQPMGSRKGKQVTFVQHEGIMIAKRKKQIEIDANTMQYKQQRGR